MHVIILHINKEIENSWMQPGLWKVLKCLGSIQSLGLSSTEWVFDDAALSSLKDCGK